MNDVEFFCNEIGYPPQPHLAFGGRFLTLREQLQDIRNRQRDLREDLTEVRRKLLAHYEVLCKHRGCKSKTFVLCNDDIRISEKTVEFEVSHNEYGECETEFITITWDDLCLSPEEFRLKLERDSEERKAQAKAKQRAEAKKVKEEREAGERRLYEELKAKFEGKK